MRKLHAKYEVHMSSTKIIFGNLFLHNFWRRIRFCYSQNHICSISCRNLENLKIRPMILTKTRRHHKGSCPLTETASIPYESLLKMIMTHVEFFSIGKLEPEISLVKGVRGYQTGGTPSRQSGGHLPPGGECFAPFWMDSMTSIKNMSGRCRRTRKRLIRV